MLFRSNDPAVDELPGPQTAGPPPLKRTRAAIAKVPYSHLLNYTMNTSQSQAHIHAKELEKEAEARKKPQTRSAANPGSLNTDIPPCSLTSWAKSIQKIPCVKHPLAGKTWAAKSYSLSASSSDSVSTPEHFQINTG